eukprot:scaffold45147_cov48-Phaeocystis_antarctica.AAC.1
MTTAVPSVAACWRGSLEGARTRARRMPSSSSSSSTPPPPHQACRLLRCRLGLRPSHHASGRLRDTAAPVTRHYVRGILIKRACSPCPPV